MQPIVRAFSAVAAVGLLPALLAAPAPQVTNYGENPGPFAGIDNLILTQSTTGMARGSDFSLQISLPPAIPVHDLWSFIRPAKAS
jgi:hypothetical protein